MSSVKKRKANAGLGHSLKLETSPGKISPHHYRKDSEGNLSWKPNSEAITDTTTSEKGIVFKNSKQKRKMNNICI